MRKYFAEFIGTFLLTFLACGVASFTGINTVLREIYTEDFIYTVDGKYFFHL